MVSLAVCSRKLRESLQDTSSALTRVSSATHAFDMTTNIMSVSVGPAFAGYDASQMAIVTSCETTITSIVHDVNDNHAKLGKDIASGVTAA